MSEPISPDGDTSFFRQFLEEVRDFAIYRLSPDGCIESWNRGAEHIFGYRTEDVLGRHFSVFFTEEDRKAGRPEALLREALEKGRSEDEGWRVSSGAALIWTSGVYTSVRRPDGSLSGYVKVTRDLSERRHREAELVSANAARQAAETSVAGLRFLVSASEALASSLDYEAVLNTVARMAVSEFADWCTVDLVHGNELRRVAMAHTDPARVELAREYGRRFPPDRRAATGSWNVVRTGEAEYCPDISDEMLARTVADAEQLAMLQELGVRSSLSVPLVGSSRTVVGVLSLVLGESERQLSEYEFWLARQLGRQAGLSIENAALHRELEQQHAQLAETAIELEQQTEELQTQAVHMEDLMAELEAANRELRVRTAEAESANHAKADFLAMMSHELRTPLNAIFGYADLLELGIHGPITPDQRNALDRIKRNQRSLLGLINDVLNFAKVEAGKLELTLAPISITTILSEVEGVVAPQVERKGIQFRCPKPAPDFHLRGDLERVEQILLNLVTNAIKFTEPGGSIEVSTSPGLESVSIRVLDTGAGIPPERLEVIFDPFIQLNRVQDGEAKGVGLGLAISRNLAVAMGGRLVATPGLDQGSEFVLTLPRAD